MCISFYVIFGYPGEKEGSRWGKEKEGVVLKKKGKEGTNKNANSLHHYSKEGSADATQGGGREKTGQLNSDPSSRKGRPIQSPRRYL